MNYVEIPKYAALHRRREVCPQGHPMTEDNLSPYHLKRGKRFCERCRQDRLRRQGADRRERYQNDPEYRAKILADNRERKEKRKEKVLADRRERYRDDPDYRAKVLAGQRERYARRQP